ncbi:MAG: hypothetical protein ACKO3G_16745 [Planctomycetaceae bacterium]
MLPGTAKPEAAGGPAVAGGPPGVRGSVPPGVGADGSPGPGGMMPGGLGAVDEGAPLRRYDFILQFAWKPVVPAEPKPAADEAGAPARN